MRKERSGLRAQGTTVVVAVALLALIVGAGAIVMAAGGTTVSIQPGTDSVDVGETTTFQVVVDDANGGVGAAEIGIAVADPSVAAITEVTVLGTGSQAVDIASDGSSADVDYVFRDTDDTGTVSIVEVTVEGQADGETDLSLEAAAGNDGVLVFDEEGTGYDVTGTNDASLTVESASEPPEDEPTPTPEPPEDEPTPTPEPPEDEPTPTPTDTPTPTPTDTPTPKPEEPDYFQIDLVQGEVIQQLDPDKGDTYHKQDRFITALIISEEESQRGGPGSPMSRTYRSNGCEVTYSWLSFNSTTGESQVVVSVSDVDGCEEITLSYAGYELPDGTTDWDPDRAEEQELKDSVTMTLEPGDETTFTVDVIDEDDASASVAALAGWQLLGTGAFGVGIVLFGHRRTDL